MHQNPGFALMTPVLVCPAVHNNVTRLKHDTAADRYTAAH